MKPEKKEHPECFGRLETVFPVGDDGLRHSPASCLACPHKTDCLRSAMQEPAGVKLRQERVDRAYDAGMITFLQRWSRRKILSGRKTRPGNH